MADTHHPSGPDRIDELLGNLQEPRIAKTSESTPSPTPTSRSRTRRSTILLLCSILVLVIIAGIFLIIHYSSANLNVRSFPAGGMVSLDGRQLGTTPLVVSKVTPGTHTIQITLDGWQTWNGTAVTTGGNTTQIIANLAHAAYSLSITSTPSGATVLLDNVSKGITPLTLTGLKPRNYTLAVSLKGYAQITRTVDLSDSTQASQDFTLVQAFGKLNISSSPAGAQVTIDDKAYGVTPLKLDSFPVGSYVLKLHLEGSKDITDTISVQEGATLSKQYNFVQSLGSVSITSDPAGASITVDGKATNQITPYTFTTLTEGSHEIDLELPGYLSWSGEAVVTKGKTSQLDVSLTKLQ